MDATMQFSEANEVLAVIAPNAANAAAGAVDTGWLDLADFHRAFVLINVGEPVGAGDSFDVFVFQAQDTDGTGARVMGAKSPDTILAADAGGYVGIELQSEELDVTNGYHCISVLTNVNGTGYYHAVTVFGTIPRYLPADQSNYLELVDK